MEKKIVHRKNSWPNTLFIIITLRLNLLIKNQVEGDGGCQGRRGISESNAAKPCETRRKTDPETDTCSA